VRRTSPGQSGETDIPDRARQPGQVVPAGPAQEHLRRPAPLRRGIALQHRLSRSPRPRSVQSPAFRGLLHGLTFPIGLVCVYSVGAELYVFLMGVHPTPIAHNGTYGNCTGSPATQRGTHHDGAPTPRETAPIPPRDPRLVARKPHRGRSSSPSSSPTPTLPRPSPRSRTGPASSVRSRWRLSICRGTASSCAPLSAASSSRRPCSLGRRTTTACHKAIGLHLPFFISVAPRFPHTVEYMYVASLGMLLAAELSVVGFLWKANAAGSAWAMLLGARS
jgi:formate transporter